MLKGIGRVLAMMALVGAMASLVYSLNMLEQPEYDPNLNVAFVGTADDADCIVLWQKDFAMMIDTGEDRDEEAILAFLNKQGIAQLDYLVLTHPDKDHIGSAAGIISALEVRRVIQPYYAKENDANRYLQARLAQNRVKVIVPSRVLHYIVQDMNIYIYPPFEKNYDDDNNYSLAVYVQHRQVAMLFPGDAMDKRLGELMQVQFGVVDLYKLPHHGRYSDYSMDFFSSLRPTHTVVTAAQASQRMTEAGDEMGTEWFYTVGSVVVFQSNGEEVLLVQ